MLKSIEEREQLFSGGGGGYMSVVGSISIRDNASSVLKSIRQEQTALRKDAAETRKELQRAWDKTYTAKINTESATRKTDGLTG